MERSEMSPLEVLEAFFEAYRKRDRIMIESLCGKELSYLNPEGLTAEGFEKTMRLFEGEFKSFGIVYEPISWQSVIEKKTSCLLAWKRGVKLLRNASLRRIESQGTAFLHKRDGIWRIIHIQLSVATSFESLLRRNKRTR